MARNAIMKEPWEMTEDEFSIRFFKHLSGREICTDQKFLDLVYKWNDFMKEYLDTKEKETGKKIKYPVNLHEEIIKWAIDNGKTVPRAVLEDYPHLTDEN